MGEKGVCWRDLRKGKEKEEEKKMGVCTWHACSVLCSWSVKMMSAGMPARRTGGEWRRTCACGGRPGRCSSSALYFVYLHFPHMSAWTLLSLDQMSVTDSAPLVLCPFLILQL